MHTGAVELASYSAAKWFLDGRAFFVFIFVTQRMLNDYVKK